MLGKTEDLFFEPAIQIGNAYCIHSHLMNALRLAAQRFVPNLISPDEDDFDDVVSNDFVDGELSANLQINFALNSKKILYLTSLNISNKSLHLV